MTEVCSITFSACSHLKLHWNTWSGFGDETWEMKGNIKCTLFVHCTYVWTL